MHHEHAAGAVPQAAPEPVLPLLHPAAAPSEQPPLVLLHSGKAANWIWTPHLAAFDDRLVVTPNLPAYGDRAHEPWPGIGAAADSIAAQLREVVDEPVDLAGFALGGAVALRLVADHPELVRSVFTSGVLAAPLSRRARTFLRLNIALARSQWWWRGRAIDVGMPSHRRGQLAVEMAAQPKGQVLDAMTELVTSPPPERLREFPGAALIVVGELEQRAVRASSHRMQLAMPQAETRVAPGMRQLWCAQEPERFDEVLRTWLRGSVHPWLVEPHSVYV